MQRSGWIPVVGVTGQSTEPMIFIIQDNRLLGDGATISAGLSAVTVTATATPKSKIE